MDENKCVSIAGMDYVGGYHRQEEIIKELQSENKRLRDTIIGMCESLYGKGGVQE